MQIADCTPGADPSTYTGYDVEAFKEVASMMVQAGYDEWKPENYQFK